MQTFDELCDKLATVRAVFGAARPKYYRMKYEQSRASIPNCQIPVRQMIHHRTQRMAHRGY